MFSKFCGNYACLGLTVRTLQVYSLNHKNPHAHTLLLYVFGIYRIMFGLRMADIDSDRQKKLIYKSKRATAKYVKHRSRFLVIFPSFQSYFVEVNSKSTACFRSFILLFFILFYLFIYLFFWYLRNVSSVIAFASMIAYAQCLLC